MDTLPLPPRPHLEQYRRRAKDLVKACRSSDPGSVRAWASDWLETLTRLRGVDVTPFVQQSFDRAIAHIERELRALAAAGGDGVCTLTDAQRLIARAHGF